MYVFLILTIYERGAHASCCFYFVCFWSLARCTFRYLYEIKKPHLGKILFGVNESNQPQILVKNIFCLIVYYIFVLNSSIEVLCHYCWSENEVNVLISIGKITIWYYPFTLDFWCLIYLQKLISFETDGCSNTCHHGFIYELMSKVMAKCLNIFMKILIIISSKWTGAATRAINDLKHKTALTRHLL